MRTRHVHHDDHHDDFGGLHRDLGATGAAIDRRGMLRLVARFGVGAGALTLIGCGSTPTSPDDSSNGTGRSCSSRIPEETAGPFPGDGSNGPTVLSASGVARNDIRSSFAGLSGQADGVPLTLVLTIVSSSTCSPLAGRAVYLWHCDRLGRYSLYSSGVTNQNYLRGAQEADANGRVSFTTIYPGCYAGRVAARGVRSERRAGVAGLGRRLQRRRVARAGDRDRNTGQRPHGGAHHRGLKPRQAAVNHTGSG